MKNPFRVATWWLFEKIDGIVFRVKDIIFKIKDYDRLESDYSKCLCYFTNNKLSKTNYEINGLITVICDTIGEYVNEGYNHAKEEFALTLEDVSILTTTTREVYNDINYASKGIRAIYEEIARRFNESRQINRRSHEKQEYKDRVDRKDMESGDGMHQGK